ncbi:MAG TPA: glycosyltransferase family 4 protein [Candidatus Saccharimonadales bacterium]|nr:glycosyltransferase family 4 protein [Candidatus Saccharimonadales bacterium]
MKIGMLVKDLDVSGGYHKLILRLSQQLLEMGHKVIIYTLSVDREKCYPDIINLFDIVALGSGKAVSPSGPVVKQKLKVIALGRRPLIKSFQRLSRSMDDDLDALIIHDSVSLYALACYQSRSRDFKAVWMLNNQLPEGFGSLKAQLVNHFGAVNGFKSLAGKLVAMPALLYENQVLRKGLGRVDVVAAYDQFNRDFIKNHLKKPAVTVYAGADLEEFARLYETRPNSQHKTLRVLSVGVLFPYRRYEDLIKATALLSKSGHNIKTTIVGLHRFSISYYEDLERLTKKLAIESRVDFIEYLSDTEMQDLYQNSDVFVFINDALTWGISVFEAVAAGLPVVITNNIGAADLIEHQQHGWQVPPRQPAAVADAIKEIISDRKHAETVARSAFDHITPIVSWRAYAERMIALLEGSLKVDSSD